MRPHFIFILLLNIVLLFSCVLNAYAEDQTIPPKAGSAKEADYCPSILKEDITTTLTIEYFGPSDKPIFTITLTTFESKNDFISQDSIWMIHTATVSKNEMQCLCKKIEDGGHFAKASDKSYEFGKFIFEIKQQRRQKRNFSANRKGSLQLFQEMLICLPDNAKAKTLLENNIKRIQ